MNTVIEISSDGFQRELRAAVKPVLVHFHTTWSGQCRILDASLETLAAEMGDELQVARLNLDCAAELAARYGITNVPTLLLFEEGTPVVALDPSMSLSQLKAELQGVLADYAPLAGTATGKRISSRQVWTG